MSPHERLLTALVVCAETELLFHVTQRLTESHYCFDVEHEPDAAPDIGPIF